MKRTGLRENVEREWESLLENLKYSLMGKDLELKHKLYWNDSPIVLGWTGSEAPEASVYILKPTKREGLLGLIFPEKKKRIISCDVKVGIQYSPAYAPGADNGNHYMRIYSEEAHELGESVAAVIHSIVPQVPMVIEQMWNRARYVLNKGVT